MKFIIWIIIFSIWLTTESIFIGLNDIIIKLNDIRTTLQMCEESVPYDPERQLRIDGEIRGNFNNY